jgi:hypothetical protein
MRRANGQAAEFPIQRARPPQWLRKYTESITKGDEIMGIEKLTKLLEEKHGKINVKDDVYYLFLKDGLFSVWYDEDEKQIKVNVEFLPEENTFVYFSEKSIEDLLE